jgi:hypothetical protein
MRRSTRSKLVVLGLALAAWSCNTTPTIPTPTPPNTTESFSGTLTTNGAQTFSFTIASAGLVTATLATVSPDTTAVIGLALGTWNGTSCQVIIANDNAVQGTTVTAAASGPGSLCARVYDAAGSLTASESVTVTVTHP